jgi:hypothetical protein
VFAKLLVNVLAGVGALAAVLVVREVSKLARDAVGDIDDEAD